MIEVRNKFKTYHFHDSVIDHTYMENGRMSLELNHVNVLENNPCNPYGVAMETDGAKVTLEEAYILEVRKYFCIKAGEASKYKLVSLLDIPFIMDLIRGQTVNSLEQENGIVALTLYRIMSEVQRLLYLILPWLVIGLGNMCLWHYIDGKGWWHRYRFRELEDSMDSVRIWRSGWRKVAGMICRKGCSP